MQLLWPSVCFHLYPAGTWDMMYTRRPCVSLARRLWIGLGLVQHLGSVNVWLMEARKKKLLQG